MAQASLNGYLHDADSQQAIPYATGYLNGSTSGAVTDESGFFRLPVRQVPAQLVASHLGYLSGVWNLEAIPEDTIRIALKENVRQLATVEIQDQDQRQKNLEEFRPLFFGKGQNPKKVFIKNEDALFFERDYNLRGRPKTLQAKSTNTLLVEQAETGYTIHVDLVQFTQTYGRTFQPNSTAWLAYYYFEPWDEKASEHEAKRYQKNRDRLYFNSAKHFLKALYDEQLAQQGYQIMQEQKAPGGGTIYEDFDLYDYVVDIDEQTRSVRGLKDTILVILYYANRDGSPIPLINKRGRQALTSAIQFETDDCLFRADGTTPGTDLRFGGTIGEKKVADMVPTGYFPANF
jgi:hypothetical protein